MKSKWLLVSAAAVLSTFCRESERVEKKEAAPAASAGVVFNRAQIEHGGVRWEQAAQTTAAPTVELPGQLVPNDDRTVRLGAPAEARVVRVMRNLGDRVSRGEILVMLQSAEASAARSDWTKAKAEVDSRAAALAYARSARERAERLLDAKAGSRQDVERGRADERLAESALTQAQAELARSRGATERLGATSATGEMLVRSPISGVVISRDAAPGAVLAAGAALIVVSDTRSLWLDVAAPEHAASALGTGLVARFRVPAFPGETFSARISGVGGSLDPQSRTLPVRGVVENRDGRLRPAMFATVLLDIGAAATGVSVPESAVVLVDERPAVFVAKPGADGGVAFERRDVEIGMKSGGRILLVKGVRPGEPIVVAGAFAIKSQFERSKMPSE